MEVEDSGGVSGQRVGADGGSRSHRSVVMGVEISAVNVMTNSRVTGAVATSPGEVTMMRLGGLSRSHSSLRGLVEQGEQDELAGDGMLVDRELAMEWFLQITQGEGLVVGVWSSHTHHHHHHHHHHLLASSSLCGIIILIHILIVVIIMLMLMLITFIWNHFHHLVHVSCVFLCVCVGGSWV